ncbi:hypothetical protein F8154_08550 [Alkaliphilus pronyensis]|uniref:Uncharacterized protein n=2 Tax=Alkaliphilus pronyensis TaxID=1482732 RepID=A0A6I0F809_9FIRM|nr:hypothetical protein F8154_08550 [Alkaliphilus pronyensis]
MNSLIDLIDKNSVEELFDTSTNEINWIWLNEEIFTDIINNASKAQDYSNDYSSLTLDNINKNAFIELIRKKFKAIGWIEVNQILFTEIEESFIPTTDIETFVFVSRGYFITRMNRLTDELEWVYKAMAIDTYQQLLPEEELEAIYNEYFYNNYMLLEDLIVKGEYKLHQGKWQYNKKNKTLIFYKNNKQRKQWAEGSTISIYNELNR